MNSYLALTSQHLKKFVSSTRHGKSLLHNRESRVNQREGYSVFGHRERIVPGGTTAGGSSITDEAIGHSPAGRNPQPPGREARAAPP